MSGLGSRDESRTEVEPNAEAGTLSVLLIEDNPGDARLIREMLRGAEELSQRVDPGGVAGGSPAVIHETRLENGRTHLETDEAVDVVLLDLNLPDSTGLDTLSSVLETTDEAAVVVLTGMRDQEVGVESIERGADDYLVKGEVSDELLVRSIHHAIERNHQERERERRRRQLETINRLNEISNDVTHLVITTSTRADLEQRVCERLAAEDAYHFAWIGQLQRGGERIVSNASAGAENGYLAEVTVTVDDGPTAAGPAGKAVETHEVQISGDFATDPSFEPWREQALERGYRSGAAIPIVHDDFLHGVLNVYATEPYAFSGPEVDILAGLGDVIGHAIAAIERKDALVSDSALELEFRLEGLAEELLGLTRDGGRIEFDRLRHADGGLLAYGTASGVSRETFLETTRNLPWVESVRALTKGDDEYEFELEAAEGIALVEILANHGGRIAAATIDGAEFRLVAELPHSVDTRRLIDILEEEYDGVEYVAQRTATREVEDRPDYDALLERELTEKQREALETAVFAGYFDWPRTSTGEEIAERLGIAPATFTQHLRAAERKFFDSVFDR